MYLQLGQRDRALRDMAAAVAIHPFLSERQLFPELGEPIDLRSEAHICRAPRDPLALAAFTPYHRHGAPGAA